MPAEAPALPFFVYGTLLTGERNHAAFLAGRCAGVRAAVLEGAALHEGPGFPYAVPDPAPGRRIRGELVTVHPAAHPAVLAALDRLEDRRPDGLGTYVRERLAVRTADGASADAWVYLAGPAVAARLRAHPALIASGDWRRHGRRDA
ncbi:gamma-glutamylcyclotransferase family protein [Kitasatospora sp. NPDC056184]|uniref:gamma-glutamylcyclotransferase family protein n=1 Tax=Kitasatospora sp. NPDC056184 TaxID=3345738 RepID=UPI0035E13882